MTTNDSKIRLTENMKIALKNSEVLVLDHDLLMEMSTYMQLSSKTGARVKREAAPGCHDDLVIATALAIEMNSARGTLIDDKDLTQSVNYDNVEIDDETGFYS